MDRKVTKSFTSFDRYLMRFSDKNFWEKRENIFVIDSQLVVKGRDERSDETLRDKV